MDSNEDFSKLYTCGFGGKVGIINLSEGDIKGSIELNKSSFNMGISLINENCLVVGNQSGEIYTLNENLNSNGVSFCFSSGIRNINCLPDKSKILITLENSRISLLDLVKEQAIELKQFEGHSDTITGIATLDDEMRFFSWFYN